MSLTADDLAYMRETQAAARPTAGNLTRRVTTRDGMGGWTEGYGAAEPIQVRLDGTPDRVPAEVAARIDAGSAVKIVTDLVDIRSGDRIVISATEGYDVISDGDPDRWATAQEVYARRYLFPARSL